MFETLSDRLGGVLKGLRNRGRLTESDVVEVLAEVRTALLEADVNVAVVRDVIERIRVNTVGATTSTALNPGQQVIKIVNDELVAMLGGETLKITYATHPPTVVLLAGLQGSGKTTNAAKLASWFKSQGRQPLLVGADLQRPAAVEQLRVLGAQISVPVFSEPGDPVTTAKLGLAEAKRLGKDVLIVDTAGRLAIDEEMMQQVKEISQAVQPKFTFLVIDAMTGQDAVTVAKSFDETLSIDGVILSKLDGDARGGAALSVKQVLGKPIAFASTGEKLDAFEQFHPDRMASRILGMGDVVSLVEKAQETIDVKEAEKMAETLRKGDFNLEDFLAQMQQVKKMGSMQSIMGMMPGMSGMQLPEGADKQMARTEAIIKSMTKQERRKPEILNGNRRKRIADGSGVKIVEVNQLLKQFQQMQQMMKMMKGGGSGMKKMMRQMEAMKGKGGFPGM